MIPFGATSSLAGGLSKWHSVVADFPIDRNEETLNVAANGLDDDDEESWAVLLAVCGFSHAHALKKLGLTFISLWDGVTLFGRLSQSNRSLKSFGCN